MPIGRSRNYSVRTACELVDNAAQQYAWDQFTLRRQQVATLDALICKCTDYLAKDIPTGVHKTSKQRRRTVPSFYGTTQELVKQFVRRHFNYSAG